MSKGEKVTVHNLYSGSWLSNCYVLISRDSTGLSHAAVVDPSADANKICDFLRASGASLDMIILTHGHFDHIMSLDSLRALTGAEAYIHASDAELLSDGYKNAYSVFFSEDFSQKKADKTLFDGEILALGNEKMKVIHLPGHTQGSIGLIGDGFLITGDTLFDGGIGRTDLYGGNSMQLYASIGKLRELDENLMIYPGHGSSASLGHSLDGIF